MRRCAAERPRKPCLWQRHSSAFRGDRAQGKVDVFVSDPHTDTLGTVHNLGSQIVVHATMGRHSVLAVAAVLVLHGIVVAAARDIPHLHHFPPHRHALISRVLGRTYARYRALLPCVGAARCQLIRSQS